MKRAKYKNTPSWEIVKKLGITPIKLKDICDELEINRTLRMNTKGFQYCFFTKEECKQIKEFINNQK